MLRFILAILGFILVAVLAATGMIVPILVIVALWYIGKAIVRQCFSKKKP